MALCELRQLDAAGWREDLDGEEELSCGPTALCCGHGHNLLGSTLEEQEVTPQRRPERFSREKHGVVSPETPRSALVSRGCRGSPEGTQGDTFVRFTGEEFLTPDLRDQLEQGLAGSYTLDRELGAGGMSRVFVASDRSLGRQVVVKVLRGDIAQELSAERFKREIQLAARLQHPHIVPLLAAGTLESGTLYYTMPLVDGQSLRDRIDAEDSGLPVNVVTGLMRDVASALAYAHAHHIVHRDIKPENVLVSHGGAMVTDFGIAKAIHAARADSAIDVRRSSTLTAAGISLGTPAYMAPEQAAGDAVDHRADLYALGVVVYEMLAGRPPFEGRSAQQLLAAHASRPAEEITRRRANVPPSLASLVMRLLEKNPADRPQSAAEVLQALETPAVAPTPATAGRLRDPLVAGLALALLVLLASLVWILGFREESSQTTRARLTLELPADARLNPGAGFGNSMTFSPDGESIVYVGGGSLGQLYSRRVDELTPHPIAGTQGGLNPQFAPNGREIGFVSNLVLKAVPVGGGTPRIIARGVGRFAWGPNGTIVFSRPSVLSPRGGLWKVSADGGTPTELTHPGRTIRRFDGSPTFLPDGRAVVFSSRPAGGTPALTAVRLDDGTVIPLNVTGGSPLYFRGHIVFARTDGTIAAVRFDAKALKVIGEPVTVLEGVAQKAGGAAELAISSTGTLLYLGGVVGQQIIDVDRRGGARVIISKLNSYRAPRFSPDGRRIALGIGAPPYATDIWVYDIASSTLTRLTTGGTNTNPSWTPDGRRIAWSSSGQPNVTGSDSVPGGAWWQPWDASAPAELLVPDVEGAKFTPSGDSIITNFDVGTANELRLVPLPYDPRKPATTLLPPDPQPRFARVSPDGHWLAYVSDETGTAEVYVQPFPQRGGHFQISSGGGNEPVWARSGTELIYRKGAEMMAATIAFSPSVTVIRRDTLFTTDAAFSTTEAIYDIAPNGRFVMVRNVANNTPPVIVFGWSEELHQRMEAGRRK